MSTPGEPSTTSLPVDRPTGDEQGKFVGTVKPSWWLVLPMGFVVIIFTIVWLGVWDFLDEIVWSDEVFDEHKWMIPVIVIGFSLLVGLCVKYLRASTAEGGTIVDAMKGEEKARKGFRAFWGTLPSSLFALLSGVSVGPEGPLAFLVEDISDWISMKLRIVKESWLGLRVASLASAYNGIIGSPIFTALFATEFHVGKKNSLQFLAWNLIAGSVGFFVYYMLGLHPFMGKIPLDDIGDMEVVYLLYAILLGAIGSLVAIFVVVMFKVTGKLMSLFEKRIMLRILLAGIVTASVAYFLPELMFSGEEQIGDIMSSPADYGIAMLLLFAVLKIALLTVALKSGFLGGPIFPVLFSATMVALAMSIAFPEIPVIILILCVETSAISLLLSAPLTAILLTTVIAATGDQLSAHMLGLIVIATATSIAIGTYVKTVMTDRTSRDGAATGETPE